MHRHPVAEADRCLAHLPQDRRDRYLSQLRPGTAIDARGTSLNAALLASLLVAVTPPPSKGPHFGTGTDFSGATFTTNCWQPSFRASVGSSSPAELEAGGRLASVLRR